VIDGRAGTLFFPRDIGWVSGVHINVDDFEPEANRDRLWRLPYRLDSELLQAVRNMSASRAPMKTRRDTLPVVAPGFR
jgi:hypothetical protein